MNDVCTGNEPRLTIGKPENRPPKMVSRFVAQANIKSWKSKTPLAGFLLAFVVMAAWQWDEYGHECELARQMVADSADSVMNALVGGVQSHRRLGPFFAEQAQAALDGLAISKDVLAVALVAEKSRSIHCAGKRDLLDLAPPLKPGAEWREAGFQLTREFRMPTETPRLGLGRGGGQGWGRFRQAEATAAADSFPPGSSIAAVLLVDRSRADTACRRAAWTRGSIVVAGWLVVLCAALAWRATVRLTESHGRAKMLEAETRHYRDLSQAAAGLAHETRNPLGLIRGWTQRLAESGVDTPDARRQSQMVVEECDRLTARINQFLAFARPAEPKLEPLNPDALAAELAVLLEPDLDAKHLTLGRTETCGNILADREMLREALFNLLQNAIHASPEREAIEISAVPAHHGWRIEVADRGPGVPDEAAAKLFTPYFTTREGGAGLGLAIVRRIAAMHGWETGYSPRPGGGAVFWLDGIQNG
jgi:two-component system, NtrC family, sensor histidine kinase HydH